MITYHVRSRFLIDIINDIEAEKIILSPHFQRKLVWRLAHKIDFIKTILLGFPFPEIFISRGTIDVEQMTSTSFVVDGQQRLTSIKQFIANEFPVDDKLFSEMTVEEKGNFLKYEIAIIDLELPHDDPRIIEIFKRLNRTFYSLSEIEKLSTVFASSEFMLVAKLLAGELGEMEVDAQKGNPNVTPEFIEWAKQQKTDIFHKWVLELPIFSAYELSRQVHLMYILNIISTIVGGYFNRNEFARRYLESHADELPNKTAIVDGLNKAASSFIRARFPKGSYWLNKANAFSLILVIYDQVANGVQIDSKILRARLEEVEGAPPADYSLAAKEAVNNKRERLIRKEFLTNIVAQASVAQVAVQ